jgi:hypothetical protein
MAWKGVEKYIQNFSREVRPKMSLVKQVVRMEGGWNWLRIVSSGGLLY